MFSATGERGELAMDSGLGLHCASQYSDNVKAIALMESIVAPIMPAESYEALPKELGDFFRMVRDPVKGPKLLVDENYFVEVALPSFISRDLDSAAHDYYRQPSSRSRPASRSTSGLTRCQSAAHRRTLPKWSPRTHVGGFGG